MELYNEDLLDLSMRSGRAEDSMGSKGWDAAKGVGAGLKLQERPVGKEGRVVPEVGKRCSYNSLGLISVSGSIFI